MIKKTMLIGVMCVSFLGISQTQCNGLTKDSVQCKNTTKSKASLCYLHNPNYEEGWGSNYWLTLMLNDLYTKLNITN